MENFSDHQIQRLKADAKKLAKAKNIKLSEAQDELAQKLGFGSLALLIHAAHLPSTWPATEAGVQSALGAFIKGLHEKTLHKIVRYEGSIWVDQDDFLSDSLSAESFDVFGRARDGVTQQMAWRQNLVLAVDLEGMASGYYFGEDDEVFDQRAQQIYTPASARKWLLELNCQGGIFDQIGEEVEAVDREQ